MDLATLQQSAISAAAHWRELRRSGSPAQGADILVAASFTAQPIEAGLATAVHSAAGTLPGVRFANYNQVFALCLNPAAHDAERADHVVVLWRIEDVFERDLLAFAEGDPDADSRIVAGCGQLGRAVGHLADSIIGSVVAGDAPVPVGFGLDHHDPEQFTRLTALQADANRAFDAGLGSRAVQRVRLAQLQAVWGTRATFDRRSWLMYRQPWAIWFAFAIGEQVAQVIEALARPAPKVLVLDCDNTLWGGVSGDDGIGALECGDTFPGVAYRHFQLAARRLQRQGVLLALASKNDGQTVVDAFANLEGMALEPDDITARRVDWNPKPGNIAQIAHELHLALDSFVFVDDSDHELGAVQAELPAVRTLRVPDDIELLPDLLAESGLFRLMRVTDDDRERTTRMAAEVVRATASTGMSHDEYLASLELKVRYFTVESAVVGRVTQLINKTNQFNLTTVRRTEADVERLVNDERMLVRAIEVEDRYGEYGLVGVAIASLPDGDGAAIIDTLLMSCRVLGRGVESALLAMLVDDIRSRCAQPIIGRFIATPKNALVAGFYRSHGFEPGDAPAEFRLDSGRNIPVPPHVTLTSP